MSATRERAVRLLRAKSAELEADAASHRPLARHAALAADIALIASLLADHLEETTP